MNTILDEPMFSPEMFELRGEHIWRFAPPESLTANVWFIAGPGPGEHRDAWLEAAWDYREQIRSGRGRFLSLFTGNDRAALTVTPSLARALGVASNEEVFIALRARAGGDGARLAVSFEYQDKQNGQLLGTSEIAGVLEAPGDGNWHELEISVTAPLMDVLDVWMRPVVTLETPGQLDLAGLIVGVSDAERMGEAGRVMRSLHKRNLCQCIYEREELRWTSTVFSCHFTFLYERGLYHPEHGYRVAAFVEDMRRRFGGLDALILWPAYPRIGVDDRNQFDFFRDMPGGIDALRGVCQELRDHGVRPMIPFLPWDTGTRRESVSDEEALALLARDLDADGIHLDTWDGGNSTLRLTVDAARPGVAFVPELCPSPDQLSVCNLSWAQWSQDPVPPGMPLLKWVEPRHIQHFTSRWNRSHRDDMETAFFNGAGMIIWENVFGASNPWSDEDAHFWKRCATLLRAYNENFISKLWDPFYPSLHEDLYIHRWPGAPTTLFTLRNMGEPIEHAPLLRWQLPQHVRADDMQVFDLWNRRALRWETTEFGWVQVWGDMESVGCIAVAFAQDERIATLLEKEDDLPVMEAAPEKRYLVEPRPVTPTSPVPPGEAPEGMAHIPAGVARMHLEHQRRECGCYPDPGTDEDQWERFTWGFPQEETVTHRYEVSLPGFYIDEAQVSNDQFRQFIEATGYAPRHPENFLRHWPGGVMPADMADLPVVYVDLDDARAYARWAGKRLPTEPEWQRAAQGDDERVWPWGDTFDAGKCAAPDGGPMPARSMPEGRGPFGLYHTSGNVWEWTESERDDGHVRFCIIRGGSWYRPQGSGWYVQGGPQPLTRHTKFLLMWPGLDRCATIGFRCVKDS